MISTTVRKALQNRKVQGALAVVFWLLVWHAASVAVASPLILVSPLAALKTLCGLAVTAAFWQTVAATGARILAGFFGALAAGAVLAVAAAAVPVVRIALRPLMVTVKSIPVASFTILALLWLRSAAQLSVLVSFLMAVPIVYTNVLEGILSAGQELVQMARVFRLPAARTARYIYLPAVMPYLRAAVSVSFGLCWKSGVAAELIGITSGSVGEALYNAKLLFSTADLFAWTAVIVLLSFACEKLSALALAKLQTALARTQPHPLHAAGESCPGALRVKNVSKRFGATDVFDGYSLDVPAGACVCLMAPSGRGKTTLANLLLGLEKPDAGAVEAPARIACAFQEDRLCPDLSAAGNVLLASGAAPETVLRALRETGLEGETLEKPASQLSGGQKRRAAVVRAMLAGGGAVLLDEPFKGLDERARAETAAFVKANRNGRTLLCITHEESDAALLGAEVVRLP